MVLVLFGVSVITFYLSHGIPGVSPIAAYVTLNTPPSQFPQIIAEYHLNQPLYVQYLYYLSGIFHGDLGISRTVNLPAATAIADFLPATVELAFAAIMLSTIIGIPLGIYAAVKANKLPDRLTRVFTIFAFSSPTFWIGLMFQILFFYYFKVWGFPYLPSSGRVTQLVALEHPISRITGFFLIDSLVEGNWPFFWSALSHIILPAVTLSLSLIGYISRIVRVSMLDVLEQPYIILARSKGLSEWVVLFKHALRNALLPTLTVIGLATAVLFSGSILVETVYAWPGMGHWLSQAIGSNDSAAIMSFTLVAATMFVSINFVVDILYTVVDPRVKLVVDRA
jgi:ABC-type dipeptide/oligopeptide/nickel transport system permease component